MRVLRRTRAFEEPAAGVESRLPDDIGSVLDSVDAFSGALDATNGALRRQCLQQLGSGNALGDVDGDLSGQGLHFRNLGGASIDQRNAK